MRNFITKLLGTTTKQLTWYVSLLFGLSVCMAVFANEQLVSVVIAVGTVYTIVLNAYFLKSFSENREKYGNVNIDVNEIVDKAIEQINNMKG